MNRYTNLSHVRLSDLPHLQVPYEELSKLLGQYQQKQEMFDALSRLPLQYIKDSEKDVALAKSVQGYREGIVNSLIDEAAKGDTKSYMNHLRQAGRSLMDLHQVGGAAHALQSRYEENLKTKEALNKHLEGLKEHRGMHNAVYSDMIRKAVSRGFESTGEIYDPVGRNYASIGSPTFQNEYNIADKMMEGMKDFAKERNVQVIQKDGRFEFHSEKGIDAKLMKEFLEGYYKRPEVQSQLMLEYQYENLNRTPEEQAEYLKQRTLETYMQIEENAKNVISNFKNEKEKIVRSKHKNQIEAYQKDLIATGVQLGLQEQLDINGVWGDESQSYYEKVLEKLEEKSKDNLNTAEKRLEQMTYPEIWMFDKKNSIVKSIMPKYLSKEKDIKYVFDAYTMHRQNMAQRKKMMDTMIEHMYENTTTLFNPVIVGDASTSVFNEVAKNVTEATNALNNVNSALYQNLSPYAKTFLQKNYSTSPKDGIKTLMLIDAAGGPENFFANQRMGFYTEALKKELTNAYHQLKNSHDWAVVTNVNETIQDNMKLINESNVMLNEIRVGVEKNSNDIGHLANEAIVRYSHGNFEEKRSQFTKEFVSSPFNTKGLTEKEVKQKSEPYIVKGPTYKTDESFENDFAMFVASKLISQGEGKKVQKHLPKTEYTEAVSASTTGHTVNSNDPNVKSFVKVAEEHFRSRLLNNQLELSDADKKRLDKALADTKTELKDVTITPILSDAKDLLYVRLTVGKEQINAKLDNLNRDEFNRALVGAALNEDGQVTNEPLFAHVAAQTGLKLVEMPNYGHYIIAKNNLANGNAKQVGKTNSIYGQPYSIYAYKDANGKDFYVSVLSDAAEQYFNDLVSSSRNVVGDWNRDKEQALQKRMQGLPLSPKDVAVLSTTLSLASVGTDQTGKLNTFNRFIQTELENIGTPYVRDFYPPTRSKVVKNQSFVPGLMNAMDFGSSYLGQLDEASFNLTDD